MLIYRIIILLFLILFPLVLRAEESVPVVSNEFITIVNPVRVSAYNPDTLSSIKMQHQVLTLRNIPATWLFSYDVLALPNIDTFRPDATNYEIGLWLEVSPELARDAGVPFVPADSWHRAKSIFLSGYPPSDRLKLIDTIFNKYHSLYGQHPKSVGAWWVDSFSLDYIQQKYQVIANLGVADQFSTDGYHVWGQYWAAPFYPAKSHTGLPASSLDQKVDIVNLQWAPRDPIHGYGQDKASLFSSQDYYTIGKDSEYLKKLIQTYASQNTNGFGQFTIGLEGDMSPESYLGQYSKILDAIKEISAASNYQLTNMSQFANWYRERYPGLSRPYLTVSPDLLGEAKPSIWYQSPNYRIHFLHDQTTKTLSIRDFRVYPSGFREPYFDSPNTELDLYINLPSVIDSASNPNEVWAITDVDLKVENRAESLLLNLGQDRQIMLNPDHLQLTNISLPDIIQKSPLLDISASKNTLTPIKSWSYQRGGYSFESLTIEATFLLATKKVQFIFGIYLITALIISVYILRTQKRVSVKLTILTLFIVTPLIGFQIWSKQNSLKYSVSNDEIVALQKLRSYPDGRIVVHDKNCLQCQWTTPYKPAAFANKREYVAKFSQKPIVYSKDVFESPSRADAKTALDKLGAKYIYTVKYDNYLETPPFSPGDLGITKIFENASSQIWQVNQ